MAKETNSFWVKVFFYLIVSSIVLYLMLRLSTSLFDVDTNIDTGNPVYAFMYYADFALFAISCIGFAVAAFVKTLKRLL
jgi:hypothetical protein